MFLSFNVGRYLKIFAYIVCIHSLSCCCASGTGFDRSLPFFRSVEINNKRRKEMLSVIKYVDPALKFLLRTSGTSTGDSQGDRPFSGTDGTDPALTNINPARSSQMSVQNTAHHYQYRTAPFTNIISVPINGHQCSRCARSAYPKCIDQRVNVFSFLSSLPLFPPATTAVFGS
jgi:hypothetical protein